MKENFYKALDKIADELLKMDDEEFEKIIEIHKDGEYAKTLKDLNFIFTENDYGVYGLHETNIETSTIEQKFDDRNYIFVDTKNIKIEVKAFNIEGYKWLSLAA